RRSVTNPLKPVVPFDMTIFGGTGDLAMRKLLPALLHRFADGQIPETSRIIGVARTDLTEAAYRDSVEAALKRAIGDHEELARSIPAFLELVGYQSLDATRDDGWQAFAKLMQNRNDDRVRVFYLSTSPGIFVDLCQRLRQHDLHTGKTRVVIEKPSGHDLQSARAINDAVGAVFDETQIYRIDHYLGKETVQNLLALRFANVLFEPLWNAAHIDHVQINVAETVGVERRGDY